MEGTDIKIYIIQQGRTIDLVYTGKWLRSTDGEIPIIYLKSFGRLNWLYIINPVKKQACFVFQNNNKKSLGTAAFIWMSRYILYHIKYFTTLKIKYHNTTLFVQKLSKYIYVNQHNLIRT